MSNYAELKRKWGESVQRGEAGCNFDYEQLSPGKFCVHISDAGGESMACYSSVELTGFFDDALDGLAYLRWVEIPRILDYDTRTDKPQPEVADAYLLKYNADERKLIDRVIGLIDRALIDWHVTASQLEDIEKTFNRAFHDTNPSIQLLSWGSIPQVLSSNYFADAFTNDINDEEGEDERPSTTLKKLLDSGNFNENNDTHLALAKDFFERHMSA